MQRSPLMATARKSNSLDRSLETGLSPDEVREQYARFSNLLNERKKTVLERVDLERAQIDEQVMTSPGDVGDVSVTDLNADYYLNLADRDRKELVEIRDAFDRMHRGVYGMCEHCENPINMERLEKLPFARLCIDCQSALEAGRSVARLQRVPKL